MKRKNKRLSLISFGVLALGGAVALILMAFEDNIVFFYSPTEITQKQLKSDQRLRLGGLVVAGSVMRSNGNPVVTFNVTDLETSVLRASCPTCLGKDRGLWLKAAIVKECFLRLRYWPNTTKPICPRKSLMHLENRENGRGMLGRNTQTKYG